MRNLLLLTAFTFTCLYSFSQEGKVINDKNAQKRNVQGFHGVHIASGVDLYLTQGSEEAVAISASDPEVRDRIRTEVKDGILEIYIEDHTWHWNHWGNQHMKAYVSIRTIDLLHATGGSDVFFESPISSDKMKMQLSGGSDLHGKMKVGELTVTQSGGSDSYLTGSAGSLDLHTSGGSDFHGYDLVAETCHVEASGGSDAYVTVNKELSATATGGSDVHYRGNGVMRESHASGSGSISHRD
jgi:Putative auto-transporter adhesin, head GIN domain